MSLLAFALAQDSPFPLDGTQPHELAIGLESPDNCAHCHAGWREAPTDAWEGTMMANAVRDPVFLAALTIAEQDLPDSGDLCLRCHTPKGWLEGRCLPGDGSALTDSDVDSAVGCDVCHRMVEAPEQLVGNAQYTIADSPSKRGMIGSTVATHEVVVDRYQASSSLCGVCHEVSNPALDDFPIERTFTEWSRSAFAQEGQTCQHCHMKVVRGYAANSTASPPRQLHEHRFVGGNAWVPEVLAEEFPELGRREAFLATAAAARELLREAADLDVAVSTPLVRGATADLTVRVTNLTGHKLPSGYPEGRRAWLEVRVRDASGREIFASGVYDPVAADLPADPHRRTYEALLGENGQQSYSMVRQHELLSDTRIPPRGFVPDADTRSVGRDYPIVDGAMVAHFDDAPYPVAVPDDAAGPLTVQVTLWYQVTTKSFVTFLRDANVTDDRGDELYRMWETYGKAPPELMAALETTLELTEAVDGVPGRCACASGRPAHGAMLAIALLVAARRRRTAGASDPPR